MQFLVNREQKEQIKISSSNHEKTVSHLADKIHRSLVRGIFPPADLPPQQQLVNKTRQESESVRDLVNNLTHLALAITEDRKRTAEVGGDDDDDDVGHSSAEDEQSAAEEATQRRRQRGSGERTFDSLERKLKRTNLMRRRESQALLDGLRKTRSSGSETGNQHYAMD
jgi:hypothetical protein